MAGTGAAFTDGFNTIREGAPFSIGCCGGLDLTGLSSLEFDLGHNGVGPINVQFFTQATPGSNFIALGPDLPVTPGVHTYSLPITGLTAAQQAYMRTVGIGIRDHTGEGNLIWTLGEVRSVGTPLASRTIADHSGSNFDGVICNFDCGSIVGGNGGQNTSGMSVSGGALHWTELGGAAGAAVTCGVMAPVTRCGSFTPAPSISPTTTFVTIRIRRRYGDIGWRSVHAKPVRVQITSR